MTSAELRDAFLKFFEEREHTRVSSASLVPKQDPTLLFNVAGMVQFKPLWTGLVEPLPYSRACSVQKCLRLEDIDVVGIDATHDTFFEMLGNFSFGDYQKEQAIKWAWEFITDIMKLPQERLWVSVHETDEEAASIWRDVVGLPKERVVYLGDEYNFWGPAGGKGACGPSSEIFWDLKWKKGDCGPGPGDDDADARYTEIWNLVFPQFDHQEDGSRPPLKYPGVDTGAGLERMVLAAQNVPTVFHTDLFHPLMQAAADTLKVKISPETWEYLAITADHVRAATFVIGEGVRPSNKEQGYVIRRVLRRAIGALYLLGIKEPLLYRLSGHVTEQMRHAYPELEDRREQVALMIKGEEERFLKTLDAGMRLFDDAAHAGKISGQDAFKLHDTHGFPIDLTKWLAKHKGVEVDTEGFGNHMEIQRLKSKANWGLSLSQGEFNKLATYELTGLISKDVEEFLGYTEAELKTRIIFLTKNKEDVKIIIEQSPFYAESGGQIGDTGTITGDGFKFRVSQTDFDIAGNRIHHGKFIDGSFSQKLIGVEVSAEIDIPHRRKIERAHTATHLLHAALRAVLGEHVKQEGSLVEPGRLRFDFYHPSPMSAEEIAEVEKQVYDWVIENHASVVKEMSKDEAESKGALAFFGEKYGDKVRVVEIPGISAELCGGTHLKQTGEIGMFLIISETGVAAGIRRIEALVGNSAFAELLRTRDVVGELSSSLGSGRDVLVRKVDEIKQNLSTVAKELEHFTNLYVKMLAEKILKKAFKEEGVSAVTVWVQGLESKSLRLLADALKSYGGSLTGILATTVEKQIRLLAFSSKEVAKKFPAGIILKKLSSEFKGGGGGSSTLAEGSIPYRPDIIVRTPKGVIIIEFKAIKDGFRRAVKAIREEE